MKYIISFTLIVSGVVLALNGTPYWGWLIVFGIICAPSDSDSSDKNPE